MYNRSIQYAKHSVTHCIDRCNMLMTEYADSTEWANREPTFQAIFESDAFVYMEPASPSADMRTFFVSDVAMRAVIDE